ncbi:MAG: hypothetical protein JNL97_15345 [Verrucomicrobiales bacterium]|nr:hypothetical protein [Verrucomicrobiales bacterium]
MKNLEFRKIVGIGLIAAAAGLYLWRQISGGSAPGERGFFYDESAKTLFYGARTAVAPIRGIDGPQEDGYRAVVYSATGNPADKTSWRVAYLEKCSPELKAKMEAAQKTGEALAMGRVESQNHRFVKRVEDADWRPMSAPDVEAVLNAWTAAGTNGATPVLCTP